MKKYEKQWVELNRRGVHVSIDKFKEFYDISRKAASKMDRLYRNKENNTLLNNRKVSKGIAFIQSKEDFDKAFKARENIISKKFIKNDNMETMKRLKKNLKSAFGNSKKVQKMIKELQKMSPKKLKEFMEQNKDLAPFLYYLDKELFEKLDIQLEDFQERIKEFDSNIKLGTKISSGDDYISEIKIKKPKIKKKKKKNIYEENLKEIQKQFKKQNPDFFKK